MRTLLLCCWLIASVILSTNTFADEGRRQLYFMSENGQYIFRSSTIENKNIVNHTIWEMYDIRNQKILYTLKEDFKKYNVLISNDGQTVVAVNDYVEGVPIDKIVLMKFYYQGDLKRQVTLGEIIHDSCNVTTSIAHFRWCFDDFILQSNGRLTITTFELIQYEFDSKTGQMISTSRHPALTDSSVYLCGRIQLLQSGEYEIKPWRAIYGSTSSSPVRFRSQSVNVPHEGCIIIDNGIYSENQPLPYVLEHCK